MAKLAFLGLGMMGAPMAARLLGAGHEVTVWNRTAERARPLVVQGASEASTPARAAVGADVVITMLADPHALEAVVFGDNGLAAALAPGQLYVDMSTVGLDAVRSAAERLPRGVTMVDAPVRGSIPQATSGSWPSLSARARPILRRSRRFSRRWAASTTSAVRARAPRPSSW